ncbi:MAG: hypothetical protein GY842_20090 [bacterium]|nr:hypothetical protein [bacterium]
MDAERFIMAIKKCVHNPAVRGALESIAQPPGRCPPAEDLRLADWLKELPDTDRTNVGNIVDTAVAHALFGFLCVLDGVRVVEDSPTKGRFELYYISDSERTLLNDPTREPLHDIYG